MDCYRNSKIEPLVSDRPEFKNKDFLEGLVKAARKGGWKTAAEISHFVLGLGNRSTVSRRSVMTEVQEE